MPHVDRTAVATSGIAVAGLAAMGAARALGRRTSHARGVVPAVVDAPLPAPLPRTDAIHAAQRLNRAAGVLAASVLADSATEHYRGLFKNRAMFTPLVTASLSLAVSAHGTADRRPAAHGARDAVYVLSALTGVVGTAFHLYNVSSRQGGISWQNLFYAAPLGAPAAISLSGALGFLAERVRDTAPGAQPRIVGLPLGRVVAGVTSAGLMGTVAEVGLLHFRGAFNSPAMFVPVTLPPVAAVLLGNAALGAAGRRRRLVRFSLQLTTLMGYVGVAFHLRGISRQMGGWRNWRQNVLNGPPVPAPPSFTGLAMAGLAALGLLEDHPDD